MKLTVMGLFLEGPAETFRARKASFSWSAFKNVEVYAPKTSYVKRTSVHIKNMNKTALQSI